MTELEQLSKALQQVGRAAGTFGVSYGEFADAIKQAVLNCTNLRQSLQSLDEFEAAQEPKYKTLNYKHEVE